MSNSTADQRLWEQEQSFLIQEKNRVPDKFAVQKISETELNNSLGILLIPTDRPKGYIRFSPIDFVVEEIRKDNRVVTVDGDLLPIPMEGIGTVYASLVKVGLSTIDAVDRLAGALRLEKKQIGYAGIKDAVALTAQQISLRGTSRQAVESFQSDHIWLKHIEEGKGALQTGDLNGNRFTLFIRTEKQLDEESTLYHINKLKSDGVLNYYGPQRFGSPRYASHIFGMLVMRGHFQQAVKTYVTVSGQLEWPYVQAIRQKVAKVWGDWPAVDNLLQPLPYTFRFEREMIRVLKEKNDFVEALKAIGKQVDMWVRAYASYLANHTLSQLNDEAPENIPLPLSTAPEAREFYGNVMKDHKTYDFLDNIKPLRSIIHVGDKANLDTKIRPNIQGFKIVPEGLILSFDLPKAAYATTILMNLFEIVTGAPIPNWLQTKIYDTKKEIQTGSLVEAMKKLKKPIEEITNRKTEA